MHRKKFSPVSRFLNRKILVYFFRHTGHTRKKFLLFSRKINHFFLIARTAQYFHGSQIASIWQPYGKHEKIFTTWLPWKFCADREGSTTSALSYKFLTALSFFGGFSASKSNKERKFWNKERKNRQIAAKIGFLGVEILWPWT